MTQRCELQLLRRRDAFWIVPGPVFADGWNLYVFFRGVCSWKTLDCLQKRRNPQSNSFQQCSLWHPTPSQALFSCWPRYDIPRMCPVKSFKDSSEYSSFLLRVILVVWVNPLARDICPFLQATWRVPLHLRLQAFLHVYPVISTMRAASARRGRLRPMSAGQVSEAGLMADWLIDLLRWPRSPSPPDQQYYLQGKLCPLHLTDDGQFRWPPTQ